MDCAIEPSGHKSILFLQGPITPFFKRMADELEREGCKCFRINLCFGDWLFWHGRESVSYRGSKRNWEQFLAEFLDKHSISDIVLLGEQRFYHQVAIELAGSRDIQIVTTDFGYVRPDWITFEKNGMSANSSFPKDPEEIKALAKQVPPIAGEQIYKDSFFQQIVWDMLYHILSTICWPLFPGYRSHQMYHPIVVYLGTGFRLLKQRLYWRKKAARKIEALRIGGEPYMIFPLQMQNDFQIRAYSKFEDIQQAIDQVIVSFAQNAPQDMRLVFKVHPLDPDLTNWHRYIKRVGRREGVSERLDYIDGGSLEKLIEYSKGIVNINSTVGIWALRQRKPVCVLGEAIYRVQGLVSEELNTFWVSPPKPDAELLDAFMRTIVAHLHVRGVYYAQPGLDNAVRQAVRRLLDDKVNEFVQFEAA